jgi:hypothetical protein
MKTITTKTYQEIPGEDTDPILIECVKRVTNIKEEEPNSAKKE